MHQRRPQPAKPRVLIVDDHPANRLAFTTLLEPKFTITSAADGQEALEHALREDYAVILLDVKMPGMDGFEVAEILRKREQTRHTPIVFMSAYDQTVLQEKRGYGVGATDFIFSPVDGEILKFKVATYAQIYLRNESLVLGIRQLQTMLRVLREDLGPKESIAVNVHKHFNTIELKLEELQGQLGATAGVASL